MYGIILVSHSKKITDGTKEMIEEMAGNSEHVKIASCGGTDDGRLGTSSIQILENFENFKNKEHILIFADIGSAILSAETAIDLVEDETLKEKISLLDCPLVEGAFAVGIQASVGSSLEDILKELNSI